MNLRVKTASMAAALVMVIGAGGYFAYETNAKPAQVGGTGDKGKPTPKVPVKTYKIGDRGPAGGWIFYDKGSYSNGWRYLEAAPVDQGTACVWGCKEIIIAGAQGTAIGTGKSNTQAIINGCGEGGIAAKLCTAYRGGGKSDWFLPSKDELALMYTNLKQKSVGGFTNLNYWSSTEFDGRLAWTQYFESGFQYSYFKIYNLRVRAVRAF